MAAISKSSLQEFTIKTATRLDWNQLYAKQINATTVKEELEKAEQAAKDVPLEDYQLAEPEANHPPMARSMTCQVLNS